jgi:hypothetical protein
MPATMIFGEMTGRSGSLDRDGRFLPTKSWRVIAPGAVYHQKQIFDAARAQLDIYVGRRWTIGNFGDPHYEDENVYCSGLQLDEQGGADNREWILTATFEPAEEGYFGSESIPDAGDEINAPIRVTYGDWTEEFVTPYDKDGNLMLNTAGDFFTDYQPYEFKYPLIRIQRNVRSWSPNRAEQYRDSVNSTTWTFRGIAYIPRCAKLITWTAEERYHQEKGLYYEETFEIAIRNVGTWSGGTGDAGQGWDLRIANVGYRKKSGSQLIQILDGNSQQVDKPVPLDSAGQPIALPLSVTQTLPMRTFRFFREVDFNDFDLPAA